MKYVFTVQRVYETEVVVDFPEGTSYAQVWGYDPAKLMRQSADFELVGKDEIDSVRKFDEAESSDDLLDEVEYIP